jgi:hypothetical protein
MQWIGNQRGATALVVFVGLLVAGCTGSDPLTPSNGQIRVATGATNVGGRFVDGPDDVALMSINRINVRPTDPQASEALGPQDLGLVLRPFRLDFITKSGAVDDRPLTSGTYELELVAVGAYTFEDADPVDPNNFADPNNPTCEDFIKLYEFNFQTAGGIFLNLSDFGQDVFRSVSFESSAALTVIFDEQAFVDATAESTPCVEPCPCPEEWQTNPDPDCVCEAGSLNVGEMARLAPSYLSFE